MKFVAYMAVWFITFFYILVVLLCIIVYMVVYFVCLCLIFKVCILIVRLGIVIVMYVPSVYSISLCCSVYCFSVSVYCTAATGCQPNCS